LPQTDVREMAHTVAYAALREKSIDLMEVYLTDGEIAQFDLQVLEDDKNFFPAYEAVWLYRADLEQRAPEVVRQLRRLEDRITEEDMRRLNTFVQRDKENEATVAAAFLNQKLAASVEANEESLARRLGKTTLQHMQLVIPSLFAAVLAAIPLGILAARRPRLGRFVLTATGILQTIPSLALLLFMMPVTKWLLGSGIGPDPAVAALFLYSLLPIVRNTHAGLISIPPPLRESAEALGLSRTAILWQIELPLAAPTILAGIKTAAVINIGTATLGGFIGAGGYGSPILRGIDKGDLSLLLEGAIPAALMALAAEGLFALSERWLARR
jgi:osmoprotectant transport system permease protein